MFPDQGSNPCLLHWQAVPPGKSWSGFFHTSAKTSYSRSLNAEADKSIQLSYIKLDIEEGGWWLRGQRICLQRRRRRFDPWVRKIPWRRKRQPTPVFLPGEFYQLEKPGGIQSTVSQRVRHNWAITTFIYWRWSHMQSYFKKKKKDSIFFTKLFWKSYFSWKILLLTCNGLFIVILLIDVRLHWVFVAACGLSLVVEYGFLIVVASLPVEHRL